MARVAATTERQTGAVEDALAGMVSLRRSLERQREQQLRQVAVTDAQIAATHRAQDAIIAATGYRYGRAA